MEIQPKGKFRPFNIGALQISEQTKSKTLETKQNLDGMEIQNL